MILRPRWEGELYLMVMALPLRVTLAVAGGLAGGAPGLSICIWARAGRLRRLQQARVMRRRRRMWLGSLFRSLEAGDWSTKWNIGDLLPVTMLRADGGGCQPAVGLRGRAPIVLG